MSRSILVSTTTTTAPPSKPRAKPEPPKLVEPYRDLTWYYQDSAAELGLKSQSLGDVHSPSPEPPCPTARQLAAARRQARIRRALADLSPRLQSVLEACYEPRPYGVQLRHEHGLAAGLVARVISEARACKAPAEEQDRVIAQAHLFVQAAHQAFRVAMGYAVEDEGLEQAMAGGAAPRSKRARRARAERWLSAEIAA